MPGEAAPSYSDVIATPPVLVPDEHGNLTEQIAKIGPWLVGEKRGEDEDRWYWDHFVRHEDTGEIRHVNIAEISHPIPNTMLYQLCELGWPRRFGTARWTPENTKRAHFITFAQKAAE